jgi:hypothetical protein
MDPYITLTFFDSQGMPLEAVNYTFIVEESEIFFAKMNEFDYTKVSEIELYIDSMDSRTGRFIYRIFPDCMKCVEI